jgi:succinoglycan biosynthesis protein ExoV
MKLYYHHNYLNNFGDELNPWIWPRLLPEIFDNDDSSIFIGIGTLLNDKVPKLPKKFVMGSGVGYGSGLPAIDRNWNFYFVRGPLSSKALGIPTNYAVSDGAILLRTLTWKEEPKQHKVSYMPHCLSASIGDWGSLLNRVGINYINPSDSIENVLSNIQRSEMIITEALHGAIIADLFRVPWIATRSNKSILDIKWHDWCSSVGLTYTPVNLPTLWKYNTNNKPIKLIKGKIKQLIITQMLNNVIRRHLLLMSSDKVIDRVTEQAQEQLQKFITDVKLL